MAAQLQTESKALLGRSFTPLPTDLLQRKCACGSHTMTGGECEECKKNRLDLHREASDRSEPSEVPRIVHEVLRSPGQPLDATTLAFFEPRFGYDFSQVRVHSDAKAADSARAVNALAYTVGRDVVFGARQYAPDTTAGRQLLVHELTHTIQQLQEPSVGAQALSSLQVSDPGDSYEREAEAQAARVAEGQATVPVSVQGRLGIARLQRQADISQAPPGLPCILTTGPGHLPGTDVMFGISSSALTARQRADIAAFVSAWVAGGSRDDVIVDGWASVDGPQLLNWRLSCERAEAVKAELIARGVPAAKITTFAHGESTEFSTTDLTKNRRAIITRQPAVGPSPTPPTPTPTPTPPSPTPPAPPSPALCTLPKSLGSARGCGSGDDFAHFDFPSISAASEAKLAAWAAARNSSHLPLRSLVSDADCELEMDGVLIGLAGGAGHAAFSRFAAGTGGTETHGPTSTLGSTALGCGSFLATVARVKANIEAQLATQAASGVLNPCALSVTPPATHFAFSDGTALKAVIGGTQGEQLFATGFTGNIPTRSYSIDLRFIICDDFGVDESDLYAPGLFAFWVLQHERSATLYTPFINQLDLPVTVRGTF